MDPNIKTLKIDREEEVAVLTGAPAILRNVMFWIGDVVWPGWCEHEDGRKYYLRYADGCKGGEVKCHRKDFFDKAWPYVKRHLAASEVFVLETE